MIFNHYFNKLFKKEIHTIDVSFKNLMLKIGEYDAYDSMALKQELRKRFRVNNRFSRDILR